MLTILNSTDVLTDAHNNLREFAAATGREDALQDAFVEMVEKDHPCSPDLAKLLYACMMRRSIDQSRRNDKVEHDIDFAPLHDKMPQRKLLSELEKEYEQQREMSNRVMLEMKPELAPLVQDWSEGKLSQLNDRTNYMRVYFELQRIKNIVK